MKRFLKLYQKDKEYIKMINQSDKGFELIVLSNKFVKEFMEMINTCNENGDEIYIVWQMKFKRQNFVLYKNCVFSSPVDNFNPFAKTHQEKITPYGKKFTVTCSGTAFYSEDKKFKNQAVLKTTSKYKDATLLQRMLKIGELNLKSDEDFIKRKKYSGIDVKSSTRSSDQYEKFINDFKH